MLRVLALLACATLAGASGPAPARIVDGDTVEIRGEKIRIAAIDAPESWRPRCAAERAAGLAAKQALAELAPFTIIERRRRDRWGRTIATLAWRGGDVGEALLATGHARPWRGKREGWC